MAPSSEVSSERVVKTLSSTDTMSVNVFEPPASIPDDSDSRSFPRLTHILSAADSCHRALPVLQLIEVELPWFPASTAARLTHVSAKRTTTSSGNSNSRGGSAQCIVSPQARTGWDAMLITCFRQCEMVNGPL